MTTALATFTEELRSNNRTYKALMRGRKEDTGRYLAEVKEVIAANPALLEAHRGSLHQGIATAASQGLSIVPVLGEAYLIPRRRNIGTYDRPVWADWVNFQIGYKGLVKLIHRSDVVDSLFTEVVYRGEDYVYRGGTDPKIEHTPNDEHRTRNWEDIVSAYAVIYIKGSSRPTFVVVSRQELEDVRDSTGTKYKDCSDVWRDHPEAQSKKTALIRLAKLTPRGDKLRDFHMVAGAESALEGGVVTQLVSTDFDLDESKPSLADRVIDVGEQVSKRWTDAVKAYGTILKVEPGELLAYVKREKPEDVTDEEFDTLEALFTDITRHKSITVGQAFRGDAVPTTASQEAEPHGDDRIKDDDIPF
jgi:phage RecT family recombinase